MKLVAFYIIYPYIKKNSKVKGYSVISEGEYVISDALKAFEKLVLYTAFSNNYFSIGEQRARINEDFLFIPVKYIDEYLANNDKNIHLQKGRDILLEFGELHREFKERVNNFSNHYDNHILKMNVVNDKEYERLIEVLVHIGRLQFLQGKLLIENFQLLKSMENEMNNKKIMSLLPIENQTFIKQLLSSTKETENSMEELEIQKEISHLPTDQKNEKAKKLFYKRGLDKLPRYKQDLRYPKP
jgi:hypothetical protein